MPWLAKCDQELTFIDGVTFDTPDEQEEFMGKWITNRTGLVPKYKVKWYSGEPHMSWRIQLLQKCQIAQMHPGACFLTRHEQY